MKSKGNYYYYTRVDKDFLMIPTKLFYSRMDKGEDVILEGDKESRIAYAFDYQGFECSDDHSFACFKPDQKAIRLSQFQHKILTLVNHEWFNILFEYWESKEFITMLTSIGKLRATEKLVPEQKNQFDFLLSRIKDTIIPEHITSPGEALSNSFINKLKEVQQEHMNNRKKYDY